jgi:hypothetical protein
MIPKPSRRKYFQAHSKAQRDQTGVQKGAELKVLNRLAGLITFIFLFSGCTKYIDSITSWKNGEEICFLIKISGLPAGATDSVTISLVAGDTKQGAFRGGNGYHKICIAMPGSMPAPTTHIMALVKETSSNGKSGQTEAIDKQLKSIDTTGPAIPTGTTVH